VIVKPLEPIPLEEWLRKYYFSVSVDIGSSGVEVFSLAEFREVAGVEISEFDRVSLCDSDSFGCLGLRQAIADRWMGGDPACVMVTHGASEAIYLTMTALLVPGDEVVAPEPCYQQLYAISESIGCKVIRWRLPASEHPLDSADELMRLVTPRTRMVVLNFPHNPTGSTITAGCQAELIEAASRVSAYLVWDASFGELVYETAQLPNPALAYSGAITIGTLSKAYGLPGLRVGWCMASQRILERLLTVRDYTTLFLSPIIEYLAERAIRHADRILELRLGQARRNLAIVKQWMEAHKDVARWAPPNGGVCAFVELPEVDEVESFCHLLARQDRVLLVPGACFGSPKHVRLGFGGPTGGLQIGLAALSARLRQYTVRVRYAG
jgi:capreomycidine synthase